MGLPTTAELVDVQDLGLRIEVRSVRALKSASVTNRAPGGPC